MKSSTWTDKQLKEKIPSLAGIDIRVIKRACKEKLNLLSWKMAKKSLLTQRMKDQRLAFAIEYQAGGLRSGKKLCFRMRVSSSCILERSSPGAGGQRGWTDSTPGQVHTKDHQAPHEGHGLGGALAGRAGRLEFLSQWEMMKGQQYLRLLDEKLDLFLGLHNTTEKAKIVMAWFNARPTSPSSSGLVTHQASIPLRMHGTG
jgi:hypothetical protein